MQSGTETSHLREFYHDVNSDESKHDVNSDESKQCIRTGWK